MLGPKAKNRKRRTREPLRHKILLLIVPWCFIAFKWLRSVKICSQQVFSTLAWSCTIFQIGQPLSTLRSGPVCSWFARWACFGAV